MYDRRNDFEILMFPKMQRINLMSVKLIIRLVRGGALEMYKKIANKMFLPCEAAENLNYK